jgi:hypothetical protein
MKITIITKISKYHKSLSVDAFIKFFIAMNKVPYDTNNNSPPIKKQKQTYIFLSTFMTPKYCQFYQLSIYSLLF